MELTPHELMSLRILAFFFYQTGSYDSAIRAVKSLLALDPKDAWAKGLLIVCESARENYAKVLALTEDLDEFAGNVQQHQALTYLRALALQKTDRHLEARALMERMGGLK